MGQSRDRFFAAVRHECPDRVPLDLWARAEIRRQLQEYFGTDDVESALGVDFARITVREHVPEFERRAEDPRGGDWPGADERYIWHDERTFEDAWGVIHRVGEDGKLIEWISGPLVDSPDVDAFAFPPTSCLADPFEVMERVRQWEAIDRVVLAEVTMPFKRAWRMRGMENLLCDMLVDLDFVEALYDRIYEFETARAVRCAQADADCITVIGDIAMEDRLLFSPDLFRKLDVPRMSELICRTREVKPDVLMFYHSDGDISDVMDDLIAVGFDIINPIQPECMDPCEVKRRWGDRVTLWGTISVRTTLPRGTPASVRAEVQDRIRRCGYNGGLVVGPTNDIMYDTPVENVVAMYEAAREFV
jgi:uroporphyrinogen decarboxylase